ncbi:hypothetical protein MSPP1_003443 [Malassezia sp. CBS 17886]|nr:hypothetical protein MSPP1_003443 [Malassezia sp. CBS 17886]
MDWDPVHAPAPPPRHELESDDEDAACAPDSVPTVHVAVSRPLPARAALVVLLGAAGVQTLVTAARRGGERWAEHGSVAVGSVCLMAQVAHIHVAASPAAPEARAAAARVVVSISQPDRYPLRWWAPVARALFCRISASSTAIVQDYAPATYIGMHAAEPPVRALATTASLADAARAWGHDSAPPWAPWEPPNTVSGCGAALFAEAMYTHCAALLLLVPSDRALVHPTYQRVLSEPLVLPHVLEEMSAQEGLVRCEQLAGRLEERFADAVVHLLSGGQAAAASPAPDAQSLLTRAAQALSAMKSTQQTGQIGDGGMYV